MRFLAILLFTGFSAFAQKPEILGIVKSDKLAEASGLASSSTLPGYYWTHNDSGNKPEVYLLNSEGKLVSTIRLKGMFNRDWEDIAEGVGPDLNKQYVYVGDIGNNLKLGVDIMVYRFEAPTKVPAEKSNVKPDFVYLRYPDGPRDAESLMVDPISRHLYVISKREKQVGLYKVPHFDFKGGETAKMEKVLTLPYTWITAGDISKDGHHIIIKNDTKIFYWHRKNNESVEEAMGKPATVLPYVPEKQGEGLTFKVDNSGYLTISEGKKPALYFYAHQF
jgi:hypothetical protein